MFEGVRYERADRAIRCMEGVFRPWIESWNAGYLLFHPTGVATIYGFQHVDGEGRPVYRVLGAEEWIEVQRETYRFVHGVEPEW